MPLRPGPTQLRGVEFLNCHLEIRGDAAVELASCTFVNSVVLGGFIDSADLDRIDTIFSKCKGVCVVANVSQKDNFQFIISLGFDPS